MSATDSALFVALLLCGLSGIFVILGVIADLTLPWLESQWQDRSPRPQARYVRPRKS